MLKTAEKPIMRSGVGNLTRKKEEEAACIYLIAHPPMQKGGGLNLLLIKSKRCLFIYL